MFNDIFSACAMEHVPQDSPPTLPMSMPLTVSGELSNCVASDRPSSSSAARPNTLNVEPVCNGAFAKSYPVPLGPP